MKKIIGLTGGIGSGKSTAAHFIEKMGYPVYYSDARAKAIVNDDPTLKNAIINLLGKEAYTTDGTYNRKWVAEQVFDNKDLLEKLNQIIHPAVKQDFETWVSQQNTKFVFKETALLFELKLHQSCYQSVLVTSEDNLRIKRVMDRDQKTYREVENIIKQQMPEKDKIKLADFIIYNNGTLEELEQNTVTVITQLTSA
ncbi:dephospho-CoA kinase [Riemerella anatipestifer]|uniref:dephospho-CoA kinase n=1 Tax=Riemerella anatipestifer TaxID=34085 RepID=UPI000D143E29|nr:dephospho-CoA kinase [Riemerella anatipestifer]PST44791.1 dephospho-CoA kinase [Riemerella anatipestifer]